MSNIKEKFTRIFRKKHVDVNELVDTNVSDDDPYRPYYPPVTLEESKANLRKLVGTMKKEEQCDRMRTKE